MHLTRRQFALGAVAASLGRDAWGQRPLPRAKEVPWLREIQQPRVVPPPPKTKADQSPVNPPELFPLLVDAGKNPIRTRQQWERHRDYLRREWLKMIGEVRPRERLVQNGRIPPEYEIRDSAHVGGIVRRRIRYETERGCETEAYLMMP